MALTVPPAFATTGDLVARWRPLSTAETTRAAVLLEDASQKILDEDKHGVLADLTAPTNTLKRIVCAMVKRAMPSTDSEGPPVTQQQWGSGPFNASTTFATPSGDLYLTKSERRDLGFSKQRAAGVDQWAGSDQYASEA